MITLVLVSRTWDGKRSLKVKGEYPSGQTGLESARYERDRLLAHAERVGSNPDYRILAGVPLDRLRAEIRAEQDARRAVGTQKAAAIRKKRGKAAFTLCPRCGARSKLLRSEMGGLETRRCQRGHQFTFDRWIHDRAAWRFIK